MAVNDLDTIDDTPRQMTVGELAKQAGVSEQYIRQILAEGKIPGAYKLGHIWAISKAAADRWLEQRRRKE